MYFTFTANDGACAGATAVLEVIEAEHLVERADAMGDVLGRLLADAARRPPGTSSTLRGRGLFRGVELTPSGGGLTAAVVAGVPRPRHVDLSSRFRPGRGRGDDRVPADDQRR